MGIVDPAYSSSTVTSLPLMFLSRRGDGQYPWVPELVSKEFVTPVQEFEALTDLRSFHPALWNCAS